MSFYEQLVEWSGWGWPLLVNHLWQATLFALFVLAISLSIKRAPARVRHWLWLMVLAKFALPAAAVASLTRQAGLDITSLFYSVGAGTASGLAISPLLSPVASPPVVLRAVEPTATVAGPVTLDYVTIVQDHNNWYAVLTLCWMIGCALLLGLWLKRRRQLSAAIRSGKIVSNGRELEILGRVRSRLGIRRKVRLVISSRMTEPGVWRIFKPVVVLPEGIAELLNDSELEAVLLHEMVHIARWDNLTSILQRAVCCVLWFHPVVWLLDRRLLAEREQSCDDTVIKLSGDSEVYASSITKVCRYSIGWEMTGLSNAGGSNLKQRLERIVAADTHRSPSTSQRLLVGAVCMVLIILSAAAGLIKNGDVTAQSSGRAGGAIDSRFIVNTAAADRGSSVVIVSEKSPKASSLLQQGQETPQRIKAQPGPPLEVKAQPDRIESNGATTLADVIQGQASTPPPPPPVKMPAPPETISAAIIPAAETVRDDLREFTGRYEVDPARVENFVLDITLENGELWLKPSHVRKRKLRRISAMSFSDAYSDFRFTCIEGSRGEVIGLRLDSWDGITARRLALPQPSLRGNTVFRLKGYADARIVALAGSFNNWNQSQLLFAREGDEWVCRVNLPRGKHQYKFIIDGNWITDPTNLKTVNDGRGNTNSLLTAD